MLLVLKCYIMLAMVATTMIITTTQQKKVFFVFRSSLLPKLAHINFERRIFAGVLKQKRAKSAYVSPYSPQIHYYVRQMQMFTQNCCCAAEEETRYNNIKQKEFGYFSV